MLGTGAVTSPLEGESSDITSFSWFYCLLLIDERHRADQRVCVTESAAGLHPDSLAKQYRQGMSLSQDYARSEELTK